MTALKLNDEASTGGWMSRRDVAKLLGIGGGVLAAGLPDKVFAQSRRNTLVIGIDISDTVTLDPARQAQYTPPMSLLAAYDIWSPWRRATTSPSARNLPPSGSARRTARAGASPCARRQVRIGQSDDGRRREVVHGPRATSGRPDVPVHQPRGQDRSGRRQDCRHHSEGSPAAAAHHHRRPRLPRL